MKFISFLTAVVQYVTPQRFLSRVCGRLANSQIVWWKNGMIKCFTYCYPIKMQEAQEQNPLAYANFNTFFTRQLNAEYRPLPTVEAVICSPVDGRVYEVGKLANNVLMAKGHGFTLPELLGEKTEAARFVASQFISCYLHPSDYHRVHMPYTGKLRKMIYVPGRLFSVQPAVIERIPNIFSRNERVICLFETAVGDMAVILVGAMIVGNITVSWHGNVVPSQTNSITTWEYAAKQIVLQRGDELGYFSLGSTVIVLLANQTLAWEPRLKAQQQVSYGASIAHVETVDAR